MKITDKTVENLKTNYIGILEAVHLYSLYFDTNWDLEVPPILLNKLERMGLIEKGKITSMGETILFSVLDEEVVIPSEDRFDEIWLLFPKDDGHRVYSKTRPIRWNKQATKKAYQELLKTGEVTHEELMTALTNEIRYRTTNSAKDNLLKYMYGSANWFIKKAYENFLEDTEEETNEYGKSIS